MHPYAWDYTDVGVWAGSTASVASATTSSASRCLPLPLSLFLLSLPPLSLPPSRTDALSRLSLPRPLYASLPPSLLSLSRAPPSHVAAQLVPSLLPSLPPSLTHSLTFPSPLCPSPPSSALPAIVLSRGERQGGTDGTDRHTNTQTHRQEEGTD
eukprot:609054-Rhodomonas_salina.1